MNLFVQYLQGVPILVCPSHSQPILKGINKHKEIHPEKREGDKINLYFKFWTKQDKILDQRYLELDYI
jgi:hypothetical protein